MFRTVKDKEIVVLITAVKNSSKILKRQIEIALKRMLMMLFVLYFSLQIASNSLRDQTED